MDGVGVEEGKGGVMVTDRGGEEKDTEVKSGDRAIAGVCTMCVRVLNIGQVEVSTRCEVYSLTGDRSCGVYVFDT